MNKRLAFDNRLCYERSLARQQAIHHQKLQTIVPTALSPSKVYLDSNTPTKQPHLDANPKRRQLDRERQMDITAQNHRLASKMEHIMHRQENVLLAAASTYGVTAKSPRTSGDSTLFTTANWSLPPRMPAPLRAHDSEHSQHCPSDGETHPKALRTPVSPKKAVHGPARVHMPGIRLDATQTPIVDCYLSPEVAIGRGTACSKHTLINRGVQKRQQERIAEENRRMKQRVQSQKPFYNTRQWDSDWQKTAQKFGHIHQNGTVGYLLPPPKTAAAKATKSTVSPRVLKAQRNVKTSHGLPLIRGGEQDHKHRQGGTRCKAHLTSTEHHRLTQGDCQVLECGEDNESDDGLQAVELAPCLLLEATTRKGVQIQVEELQVELMRADLNGATNGCVDGDRGLLIRGRWGDDVRGEHFVDPDSLERVAQEIDDLEIMIKLETVHRIPQVGNFPRLSELLTEAELEKLLVRLVQRLHIEILDDQRVLEISMRCPRNGRGAALTPSPPPRSAVCREVSDIESEDRPHRPQRPRTCPFTMSRALDPLSDFASTLNEERPATTQCKEDAKMQAQLESWINKTKGRIGIRHRGVFYLVGVSYSSRSAALVVSTVNLATGACATTQDQFSSSQVEMLVRHLESREFTCEDFVRQELLRVLS